MQNVIHKNWYHEPWFWFNLLLLSAAITTAVVMTVIAMRHSPAELDGRWYKEGALAKQARHEEVLIGQVHLSGDLAVAEGGKLTLTLHHDLKSTDQQILKEINVAALDLYIEHPTDPEKDMVLKLIRIKDNLYSGQLTGALSGKRRLMISPDNEHWYLIAAAYFPVSASITFKPGLG